MWDGTLSGLMYAQVEDNSKQRRLYCCASKEELEKSLTNLGALETKKRKRWELLLAYYLYPYSSFKAWWNLALVLFILLDALEVPFSLSFEFNSLEVTPLFAILVIMDIFFLADVAFNFLTSYYNNQLELIIEPKMTAREYLRSWFVVDMLGSIPFTLASAFARNGSALSDNSRTFSLIRVFKIPRMMRLIKLFDMMDVRMGKWFNEMARMFRLLISLLLVCHWIACLWWYIGKSESIKGDYSWVDKAHLLGDNVTTMDRYVHCIYWSLTTLTTVGYGDITPVTQQEMLFTCFVEVCGAVVYATVVGSMMLVIQNLNEQSQRHTDTIQTILNYTSYRKFPNDLRTRVLDYTEAQWKRMRGHDEEGILSTLPPSLRSEIAVYLHWEMASKAPIFKGCTPSFIRCVLRCLRSCVYLPGSLVIHQQEPGDEMMFIDSGVVELIHERVVFAVWGQGQLIGESALLDGVYDFTARASSYCNLSVLHRIDYNDILSKYPAFHDVMVERVKHTQKLAQNRNRMKKLFAQ